MPQFSLFWGWRVHYNSIFCDVRFLARSSKRMSGDRPGSDHPCDQDSKTCWRLRASI